MTPSDRAEDSSLAQRAGRGGLDHSTDETMERERRLMLEPVNSADGSRLLSIREAAKMLDMTAAAVRKWRERGAGPPFFKLSERRIRIRADVLARWMREREESDD